MDKLKGKALLKNAGARIFKKFYAGKGQILMFHRVVHETGQQRIRNTGIEVTPEKLEEIIKYFKSRNYSFITLDELPLFLDKDQGKFVIFTFDDGYVDNLTIAYPIFEKHGIPFTIYVTTDFPERKAIMWWYLLEELLLNREKLAFRFDKQQFSFSLKTIKEKEKAFADLRRMIIDSYPEEKRSLFQEIFINNGIDLYRTTRDMALSWEQLTELGKNKLVTIGAHTKKHLALSTLSEEQIKEEVLGSKILLEEKLKLEVKHFAYPFGSSKEANQREFSIIEQIGFNTATTTREGNIFKAHLNNITALPRLYISPKTSEKQLNDFVNGTTPFKKGVFHRIVTV